MLLDWFTKIVTVYFKKGSLIEPFAVLPEVGWCGKSTLDSDLSLLLHDIFMICILFTFCYFTPVYNVCQSVHGAHFCLIIHSPDYLYSFWLFFRSFFELINRLSGNALQFKDKYSELNCMAFHYKSNNMQLQASYFSTDSCCKSNLNKLYGS